MYQFMPRNPGGGATSANLYPYVWLDFGGNWVHFQSKGEQTGYTEMVICLGSFSNMGTIFSIHMKQLYAYIIRDTLTGLTFQRHNQNILFVLPLWVYFWEGIFQPRTIRKTWYLGSLPLHMSTHVNHVGGGHGVAHCHLAQGYHSKGCGTFIISCARIRLRNKKRWINVGLVFIWKSYTSCCPI